MARCEFIDDSSKQCRKKALPLSTFCREHAEGGSEYEEVVDTVLEHPSVQKVVNKASGLLDQLAEFIDRGFKPKNPQPLEGGAPKKVFVKRENPRDVLHFGPKDVLTEDLIKERRRELAKMVHPDKGGSEAAMQRINMAADILINSLKKE